MPEITLIENMIHNGYLPVDVLWDESYQTLQDWFEANRDRKVVLTMSSGGKHTGKLATEHPFDVPGFLAVVCEDCIVLVACGIDSSWRTTDGVNPQLVSIEYEGYEGGSPR